MGEESENLKEGVEVAKKSIVTHRFSENQWNRSLFRVRKWESEKQKNWSMPAEGFEEHIATDGSLLGTAGKWSTSGWSVVQLDDDQELGSFAWDVRLDGGSI